MIGEPREIFQLVRVKGCTLQSISAWNWLRRTIAGCEDTIRPHRDRRGKVIPMSGVARFYITRSEQMTDQNSESEYPRDERKDPKEQSTLRDAFANLLNPVPLVSLAMLLGVMF